MFENIVRVTGRQEYQLPTEFVKYQQKPETTTERSLAELSIES